MDHSGGEALGCRGLTGAGTGGQCDHTSSKLVRPAAPSKRQAFPNAHLADPSSMLGGPSNHLGLCGGRCSQSPQLLRFSLLHHLPHHHLYPLPQPL
ncbi:hypothetical protein Tco_0343699 [Tanacetum coccineum]